MEDVSFFGETFIILNYINITQKNKLITEVAIYADNSEISFKDWE